jgi:hypothetical protein
MRCGQFMLRKLSQRLQASEDSWPKESARFVSDSARGMYGDYGVGS